MSTRTLAAVLTFCIAVGTVAAAKESQPPLPEPKDGRGAIAMALSSRWGWTAQVYFVRVEGNEDPLRAENVIFSNFSPGGQIYPYFPVGQIYLLNAKPGRYFAVAAKLFDLVPGYSSYTECRVYFPEAMILQTEVIVSPGTMTFMGDYVVKASGKKRPPFDPAQTHYRRLLSPNIVGRGYSVRMPRREERRGELQSVARTFDSEVTFWTEARRKVFGEEHPAWLELVQRKLDALQKRSRPGMR